MLVVEALRTDLQALVIMPLEALFLLILSSLKMVDIFNCGQKLSFQISDGLFEKEISSIKMTFQREKVD